MTTKFFTNENENTLISKFEGVLKYNPNIKFFDSLVGYFRSSGYFKVRPFLLHVPQIRILVGINVDKLLAQANDKGLDFFKNSEKTKDEFIEDIKKDISEAKYDKETEDGILQFIDDLITKKIEVRAHPDKKIHAKIYIFRPDPFNEHTQATVITGSSNFTDAGLGSGVLHNYEFNVQLNDYQDVKFAADEFEKLWAESIPLLPVDVQDIKKQTHLNDTVTPFELYVKVLTEYFDKNIDYDPDALGDLPDQFKKLSYQIDAVNEGFNMLLEHNGFILADVVGLGKTIIATLVAKKFIMKNGRDYTKILVVYPPAVEKNWKNTFREFKLDRYVKFISNGSLQKILDGHQDYWLKEDYDLIIVDEAHKFRNHTSGAFDQLQKICKSPRSNKGSIAGEKFIDKKKVILVSATPLNNRPDDILHQVTLFQEPRQSTLYVSNLTSFFNKHISNYKELKREDALDVEKLRDIYADIRKNIIQPITIRRSRTDLESIPAYKQDLEEQGIVFPKVNPPKKVEYFMDTVLSALFLKTVDYLTDPSKLTYARYQAVASLKPEFQENYENAERISKSLAFIIKTQLVKRIESSFYAFKASLKTFQKANARMIDMFAKDQIFIAPDLDINKLMDKGLTDEEIAAEIERINVDLPKNQQFKADNFAPEFLEQLQHDAVLLDELVESWEDVKDDPKLKEFLAKLSGEFLNPKTNLNGKLVIFSESKDTVTYLSKALADAGRDDVLVISSENRREKYDTIVENFDANYPSEADKQKGKEQKNDYNIIITTEVLAEGVNLHRANVVIHYDTPWNSTKLMQRIGRVNRIGTSAKQIYNYVFYPSAQGNEQIKLTQTAFMKIQAFHATFGEDNQIFSTDEIMDESKLFNGEYKEAEDERLKYLHELRQFKKENRAWFEKIRKLPMKSRTGRIAKDSGRPEIANGTAAFLKTSHKLEFYWIEESKPTEITPLEAFKLFKADREEKPAALIEQHHEHVQQALNHFEQVEQDYALEVGEPIALGVKALRVKKFLADLAKLPIATEKQQDHIKKLVVLIEIGRYTKLPDKIDKVLKAAKKGSMNPPQLLQQVDLIAAEYNVKDDEISKETAAKFAKPQLILSESFK